METPIKILTAVIFSAVVVVAMHLYFGRTVAYDSSWMPTPVLGPSVSEETPLTEQEIRYYDQLFGGSCLGLSIHEVMAFGYPFTMRAETSSGGGLGSCYPEAYIERVYYGAYLANFLVLTGFVILTFNIVRKIRTRRKNE